MQRATRCMWPPKVVWLERGKKFFGSAFHIIGYSFDLAVFFSSVFVRAYYTMHMHIVEN